MTFILLCLIGWSIWSVHGKLNELNERLAALSTTPGGECNTISEVVAGGKKLLTQRAIGIGLARIALKIVTGR